MTAATSTRIHPGPPEVRRSARSQLRWHLAAYAVLLVGLAALGHLGASWTSDDGAYATQVATLRETGAWAQPASEAAPDLRNFAYPNATRSGDRGFVYVDHPAWIVVLVGTTSLFGHVIGLYLVNLAAAAVAAACAWTLARRLDGRLAPAAFWLVGLGPVLIHATTIWAHATAAALGGVAALALVRLVGERPRTTDAAVLAAAIGAMVLVRSEGVLLAGAAVVTLGCSHLVRWGFGRLGDLAVRVGPTIVLSGAAMVLESRWVAHLVPGATSLLALGDETERSWVSGRVPGFVASFLEPGATLTTIGCVLLLATVVLVRRGEGPVPLPAGLAICGAAALALRLAEDPGPVIGGLLPAAPVAALGWLGWRAREASTPERALAGLVVTFMAFVVLTQYAAGGAFEWGGRFLAPVLVPFTVLGVHGAATLLHRVGPGPARRGAVWLLGLVTVVVAATGLHATTDARRAAEGRIDAIAGTRAEVVVSLDPGLPRFGWRTVPETTWLGADRPPEAAALVDRIDGRVAVAGPGADRVRLPGRERTVVEPRLVVFSAR